MFEHASGLLGISAISRSAQGRVVLSWLAAECVDMVNARKCDPDDDAAHMTGAVPLDCD